MRGDALVSFLFHAFLFGHGLHNMAGAATAGEHAHVEKIMCEDMPSMCPCNAHNLQVNLQSGRALVCGESQIRADMYTVPIIHPPIGVTLEQTALYTLIIVDRDAPSRTEIPPGRFWEHGLYADITGADMNVGIISNGRVLMEYFRPAASPGTGAHSYQILLLKQDPSAAAVLDPPSLSFYVQNALHSYNMCDPGDLIGAFEYICSNPDGEDTINPDRPCPKPSPVSSTAATTTASISVVTNTTRARVAANTSPTTEAGSASSSSRRCDILLALVAAVLFRVLLV